MPRRHVPFFLHAYYIHDHDRSRSFEIVSPNTDVNISSKMTRTSATAWVARRMYMASSTLWRSRCLSDVFVRTMYSAFCRGRSVVPECARQIHGNFSRPGATQRLRKLEYSIRVKRVHRHYSKWWSYPTVSIEGARRNLVPPNTTTFSSVDVTTSKN